MDNYIIAVKKALENPKVTINVMDQSEDHFDLEGSRDVDTIVEAAEATDSPLLCFYEGGESRGNMLVLVGYGDESICDHHSNPFMDDITEECYD